MKKTSTSEQWIDIKGYENLYQISNYGNVKSLEKNIIRKNGKKQSFKPKILKSGLSKNGYLSVALTKNKKMKTYFVHKLVANMFIENKNNYKCVNHKDGNKLNNNVDNLEWCSYNHNLKEAYKLGLKKPYWLNKKGKDNKSSKKVVQLSKKNEIIKIWDSLIDTQRYGNFNFKCVCACCKGKQKYHKNFIWKYYEEFNQ